MLIKLNVSPIFSPKKSCITQHGGKSTVEMLKMHLQTIIAYTENDNVHNSSGTKQVCFSHGEKSACLLEGSHLQLAIF